MSDISDASSPLSWDKPKYSSNFEHIMQQSGITAISSMGKFKFSCSTKTAEEIKNTRGSSYREQSAMTIHEARLGQAITARSVVFDDSVWSSECGVRN